MQAFYKFLDSLVKLKVNRNSKLGPAPHKPILLLSIFDNIENVEIISEHIYITPELVASYRENWNSLVESKHSKNFHLPFFHMKSEPFWSLEAKPGLKHVVKSISAIGSINTLNEIIAFATITPFELVDLLKQSDYIAEARATLLKEWFPRTASKYLHKRASNNMIEKLMKEIQSQSSDLLRFEKEQIRDDEETQFVRSGLFKRVVSSAYNYTCSMTRLQIHSLSDVSMIDACHIIPFSVSGNNHFSNGISLCPNLHRAFDRGLVAIRDDYTIAVSNSFLESSPRLSGLKDLEGLPIILPDSPNLYPSKTALSWHFEHVFDYSRNIEKT